MWLQRSENTDLRPSVKDAVRSWGGHSVSMLTGDSRAFPLCHSWMIRHYLAEYRVRVIDCAVRYDSISMVDELLRLDLDVDFALKSIDVRRAFTPYQILEAISDIPQNGIRDRDVYYLLAPYKQFFDGDVATDEAAYLLHLLNERLLKLSREKWSIVVVEKNNYEHAAFNSAYNQLKSISMPLWQIVDIRQPTGITSVLRTTTLGGYYGQNNRTLQHSNGTGRTTLQQVSPSLEKAGSRDS